VTADFADVLNVVPRSPVMVDDVTVGEVVDVERIGWHARVTLRVRDDVELPDNTVADIRQVSLLGEKYVALEAPSGEPVGRLEDGDRIELPSTGRNPEVEEVLGALSYLLSGGGVAQLGTITRELNDVMDGREERLKALLGNLSDVVGTLDRQKAEIIRAMESIAGLTRTLNREKQVITDAIDATGPAIGVLREQHDELVAMLGSLDELGTVGTRVIRASKEDLLASLRDLRPVLRQLNAAGDHLAPGLNLLISFPFPKEASEIVKGDYANTSIRADISLENLLPGGGVLPPVEVPDPVETVGLVLQCLASGSLTSKPCSKVLADVDLLTQLKKKCRRPAHEEKAVCQVLNLLPDLPGLEDLGGLLGGGLDGLLDGLAGGAPSATGTSRPTLAELVGGGAA
jgi:phospholipid/cholesterol/gamma-HCH transport system substrate-binding protein